jgi:hypothetical protein
VLLVKLHERLEQVAAHHSVPANEVEFLFDGAGQIWGADSFLKHVDLSFQILVLIGPAKMNTQLAQHIPLTLGCAFV